ncbi:MAG: SAM-dependent methyltransferase, partial [Acholeplasmataceae bacterium]|nr:SAM-dependent methyltransferase [Acholeplasmataceae bacterium]
TVLLDKLGFSLKRMRFVHPKREQKALMVLLEASSKGQKGDLKVIPPLIVHDDTGGYTETARGILKI